VAGSASAVGTAASSLSGSLAATTGLSLGVVLGPGTSSGTAESAAVLVAVQGNNYSTVALLDFGSSTDDEAGQGGGRMPWLSTSHALGDTSPLTRFVIGHEEALQQYRDGEEARRVEDSAAPTDDPWNADLFQGMQPFQPPLPAWDENEPMGRTAPESFWDRCPEEPVLLPSPAVPRTEADLEALAVLLAGMVLTERKNGSGVE
jgi:hypothetical protein